MLTIKFDCQDADFTPKGKRTARLVTLRSPMGRVQRLRMYVGGRIFRQLPFTAENVAMIREWGQA